MPQFDLSTLSTAELRSLLDSARARGQAEQAYSILQEMAARREQGPFAGRRVVSLDLGDPLDRPDPAEAAPAPLQPEAEASEPAAPDEHAFGPLEIAVERARPPAPRRAPKARKTRPAKAAPAARAPEPPQRTPHRSGRVRRIGFAAGALAGVALGVGGGVIAGHALSLGPELQPEPAASVWTASAPAGPPVQAAELPPAAPDALMVPELQPQPAAPSSADALVDASVQVPPPPPPPDEEAADAPEAAPPEPAEPAPLTEAAVAKPVKEAASPACARAATPADRVICEDSRLQALQRDLQKAYADALAAHEDRALLRQRQLAWREARNAVAEPERLAALYEQRIARLNAATEAARKAR